MAGRPPESVQLVAVTKTVDAERIRAFYPFGVDLVGENRVQEALEKQSLLSDLPLTWHLIGHLQTNKVRLAVGRFALIHSVDSLKLLAAIDAQARTRNLVQDILLEVNVAGEATKFGFRSEDVSGALAVAMGLPGVRVKGLMTLAPPDPLTARPVFKALAALLAEGQRIYGSSQLTELSMGMSQDYRAAIAEGATLVRIGTALFGKRPGAPGLREEAR